ncbi:MAG: response regulator [Nitrososphaera sp.]
MSIAIRLLVVEDEPDILYLVQKHLRNNGFEPTGFSDPLKALDDFKADPTKYSLVLTDIRMPGMNGVDLAHELLNINPSVRVILITAYDVISDDLRAKLPVVSIDDIIRKPFRLVEICNRVKQLTSAN